MLYFKLERNVEKLWQKNENRYIKTYRSNWINDVEMDMKELNISKT